MTQLLEALRPRFLPAFELLGTTSMRDGTYHTIERDAALSLTKTTERDPVRNAQRTIFQLDSGATFEYAGDATAEVRRAVISDLMDALLADPKCAEVLRDNERRMQRRGDTGDAHT